mmetsp:Transcript_90978/g.253236  ORF Transcript_90978/g.253236 Transcript_90978/m.253236 type:complete len:214 (-) Transcript_90978:1366-2007(-)
MPGARTLLPPAPPLVLRHLHRLIPKVRPSLPPRCWSQRRWKPRPLRRRCQGQQRTRRRRWTAEGHSPQRRRPPRRRPWRRGRSRGQRRCTQILTTGRRCHMRFGCRSGHSGCILQRAQGQCPPQPAKPLSAAPPSAARWPLSAGCSLHLPLPTTRAAVVVPRRQRRVRHRSRWAPARWRRRSRSGTSTGWARLTRAAAPALRVGRPSPCSRCC